MSEQYLIAVNKVENEIVVTRSRFVCYLSPCKSINEAKLFVKSLQRKYPQASHHCYAFMTKSANDSLGYGYSDDGEPSGTAGKPMLAVLKGGNVGEVCAVVVRYFGGTKLGTGGLQRAYADSVRQALTFLRSKVKIPMAMKTLACQYKHVDDVLHIIDLVEGQLIEQSYLQQITLKIAIPEKHLALAQEKLTTLSAGAIVLKPLDLNNK